jgi:hypothetical protein
VFFWAGNVFVHLHTERFRRHGEGVGYAEDQNWSASLTDGRIKESAVVTESPSCAVKNGGENKTIWGETKMPLRTLNNFTVER